LHKGENNGRRICAFGRDTQAWADAIYTEVFPDKIPASLGGPLPDPVVYKVDVQVAAHPLNLDRQDFGTPDLSTASPSTRPRSRGRT
jgi:hypothetical protein